MKLELDINELNMLYFALSKQLERAKTEYADYPSHFFHNQLLIAEKLVEKAQNALYEESK